MTADEPLRLELDRLLAYDTESILAEMKRVAGHLDTKVISRKDFDAASRVSSDTCIRRFGGWREALIAGGYGDRYGGKRITSKMRGQLSRTLSSEDIVNELRRIAALTGKKSLTRAELLRHSEVVGERVVLNRFGSWRSALEAAGLELSSRGRRWSDDDYFENLLTVWTHCGRAPRYAELDQPPSRISSGGYAAKFGTWGSAKAAFIERVNADVREAEVDGSSPPPARPLGREPRTKSEDRRAPSLGLRYRVLRRDRYRCVLCGRSPATDVGCVLHVDHVEPFSRGERRRC